MSVIEAIPRLSTLAKEGWQRTLDLIYPPQCLSCGVPTQAAHGLCPACWGETAFLSGALCATCAQPLPGAPEPDLTCDACLAEPPPWTSGMAAVGYEGAARRAILAFKHSDRLDTVPSFVTWMARAGAREIAASDVVVPVPLHHGRLWRRGFNQAAELARALSERHRLAYAPRSLQRTRPTPSMRGLDRAARRALVEGAFEVPARHAGAVAGARVLLVDDVMTTGATLSACANALSQAGTAEIRVLCLARVEGGRRAPLPHD